MPTLEERLLLDQLSEEVHASGATSPHALVSLLQSTDWTIRSAALGVMTLMTAPSQDLVTLAESFLDDDTDLVRLQAVRAICKHSLKQRAETLLKHHHDDSKLVNDVIALYLGEREEGHVPK